MLPVILLTIFSLIAIYIIVSAIRNPIPRKIGFRNVRRRLGNTILVIIGSMVGTALITGSLVMQDSLEDTSLNIVKENVGETDAIIRIEEKTLWDTDVIHLNRDEVVDIDQALLADSIDGVLPIFEINISPTKLNSQGEPVTQTYISRLIGLDPNELSKFGKDPPDLHGLSNSNAIASESLASSLDLNTGDTVSVQLYGKPFEFTISDIVEENGVAAVKTLIVDKNVVTGGFNIDQGSANTIWISAVGGVQPNGIKSKEYKGEELQDILDGALGEMELERVNLDVNEIKEAELDGEGMNQLSNAFLFLSLFGAFAGIILIINLYSMLAEERRREMGILRAISLSRSQLVKTFIFEGFIYTLLASVVGVGFGLLVGYLFTITFASIFGQLTDVFDLGQAFEFKFSYSLNSLIFGGISGFIMTVVTVILSSYSIGKLKIVNAIRGLRDNERYRLTLWRILKMSLSVVIAVVAIFAIFVSFQIPENFDNQRENGTDFFAEMSQSDFSEFKELAAAYPFFIGVNLLIWILALIANTLLKLFNIDYSKYARYLFSIASVLTIIFNVSIARFEYVSKAIEYQAGSPIFFLNGTFLVIASAVLLSFNMDILGHLISFIIRPLGRAVSTFKIALRYPHVNPKRSGLTLIMFAIIIYLIVFISSFKESISQETEAMRQEFMGDYAVRVSLEPFVTSRGQESITSKISKVNGVEEVVLVRGLSLTLPEYTRTEELEANPGSSQGGEQVDPQFMNIYSLIGPDHFLESLDGVIFQEKLDSYETDDDIWRALQTDKDKIVLGYWFDTSNFRKDYLNSNGDTATSLEVGDKVIVGDIFGQDAGEKEIIAKVSNETRNPYAEGIIASEKFLEENFSSLYKEKFSSKALLIKEEENVDLNQLTKDVEKTTMGEGVSIVMNVDALIGTAINIMRSMFVLFQGFLALSLLIGSSGLAIIIARAAIERKQQIGMLRAIGFQRSMVLVAFFIESTFIAILAIAIGVSMGIVSVENSFEILMAEAGMELSYPVGDIILIVLFVYLLSVVFSIWPALKAAKLEPVEATNYPE